MEIEVRCAYRYRLYDSKANKQLDRYLCLAAEIWNHCIALHRRYYKLTGKHISAYRMKKHLTKLMRRPRYQNWHALNSQAIQDIVERIERSYKAFFDHVKEKRPGRKSPPKFRKRVNYVSFTLKQCGYSFDGGNRVTIMGKPYKFVNHRPIDGEIKTLTVKRTKTGKYLLCVSVVKKINVPDLRTDNAVGIDFGLKTFLTLDNGEKLPSPRWYHEALPELRKAHRNLSRCQKGSNNRKRRRRELALLYERIENARTSYFFVLANRLFDEYDVVCVEDLNVEGMKRLWGQKVSDLAYSEFVRILEWVAVKRGKAVSRIDRWYPSSKACSVCGYVNDELTLEDRSWVCPCCGTAHDRDVNAAVNIRNEGVRLLKLCSA